MTRRSVHRLALSVVPAPSHVMPRAAAWHEFVVGAQKLLLQGSVERSVASSGNHGLPDSPIPGIPLRSAKLNA